MEALPFWLEAALRLFLLAVVDEDLLRVLVREFPEALAAQALLLLVLSAAEMAGQAVQVMTEFPLAVAVAAQVVTQAMAAQVIWELITPALRVQAGPVAAEPVVVQVFPEVVAAVLGFSGKAQLEVAGLPRVPVAAAGLAGFAASMETQAEMVGFTAVAVAVQAALVELARFVSCTASTACVAHHPSHLQT